MKTVMNQPLKTFGLVLAFAMICGLQVGCESMKVPAADPEPKGPEIGDYPPVAAQLADVERPTVGVPDFDPSGATYQGARNLNKLVADQLTTLLFQTDRVQPMERLQLTKLLDEQGFSERDLNNAGVDYLMTGKITSFTTRVREIPHPWIILPGKRELIVEVGIDLRMVDLATGKIVASEFVDQETVLASETIDSTRGSNLRIPAGDFGKVLRNTLDGAVRKMIPTFDKILAESI